MPRELFAFVIAVIVGVLLDTAIRRWWSAPKPRRPLVKKGQGR